LMKSVKSGEKNTTDYLLMFAAALIIVAIAVYYVMVIGSKTISVDVGLKTADNTVWLKGTPGCVAVANWDFEYQKIGDGDWYLASGDIGPGAGIRLVEIENRVSVGDNVAIKYDNTTRELQVQQMS